MNTKLNHKQTIATIFTLALTCWSGLTVGQTSAYDSAANTSTSSERDHATNANRHVDAAVNVVHRMESESGMDKMLQQAKGIFIVPNYGRAALVVGAAGGSGVLLVKHGATWSDPAFYTVGGISAGAQAGIEKGSITLILNSEKAVNNFTQNNKFSMDANAGLTIINWSKTAERPVGRGDVVAWSDNKGLFGELAIGVTDIRFDAKQTSAYYQRNVAATDVLNGNVQNPQSMTLKQALVAATAAATSSDHSLSETSKNQYGSLATTPTRNDEKHSF
jgi:lipid-binding SYLF domain-containing protein